MDWITHQKPALVLAPMEGVTDSPMRAFFSERGGFSFCVAEFLRVTQELIPRRTFIEHVPELKNKCLTPTGLPVQVQLLGGSPDVMAMNAVRAVELGAKAIDINFGCPAPTVNRRDGGATLLKYPERIKEIVSTVRLALPKSIPVSAKLRLGWENVNDIHVNALKAVEGGASWITIHARTKVQGYAPPVNWGLIGEIRKSVSVPVVANGDIWTREDFLRCMKETGCIHFMLGRGAMVDPTLPQFVAGELDLINKQDIQILAGKPSDWKPLLERFIALNWETTDKERYVLARMKQWLKMAHVQKRISWFDAIKQTKSVNEFMNNLVDQDDSQSSLLNFVTTGSDLIELGDQSLMNKPLIDLARLSAT